MNKHIAIAIDGPAASGKSTVARLLAKKLNLIMVNTGDMYRTVTWVCLKNKVNPSNEQEVLEILNKTSWECGVENNLSQITANEELDKEALRTKEVNANVSKIAAIPAVRDKLVSLQQDLLSIGHVVMEGRDIGSVVFPDTPYKFYIDASEEVRQQRRSSEGIADSLSQRDKEDSQRITSPLIVANDATVIDSSELSIDEVMITILSHLKQKKAPFSI